MGSEDVLENFMKSNWCKPCQNLYRKDFHTFLDEVSYPLKKYIQEHDTIMEDSMRCCRQRIYYQNQENISIYACSRKEKCFSHINFDDNFIESGSMNVLLDSGGLENECSSVICKDKFKYLSTFNDHICLHMNKKIFAHNVNEKIFQHANTVSDNKSVLIKENSFVCKQCKVKFANSVSLKCHMATHTNKKPRKCDQCEKEFRDSYHLVIHKRIHSKEKPYTCGICKKKFSQNSNLRSHMRIHTKEKPYACDICNSRFTQSSHLLSHMRIHTNEKPYTCNICMDSFAYLSVLRKHMLMHRTKK